MRRVCKICNLHCTRVGKPGVGILRIADKKFNAYKADILMLKLLKIVFLTRYSNASARASYTFYPP